MEAKSARCPRAHDIVPKQPMLRVLDVEAMIDGAITGVLWMQGLDPCLVRALTCTLTEPATQMRFNDFKALLLRLALLNGSRMILRFV